MTAHHHPFSTFQESKMPGARSTLETAARVETQEGFSPRWKTKGVLR